MITRIRHFSVTSHTPTVVTPNRSSAGSFPPYEGGFVPEIGFSGHSEGSAPSEDSNQDYLKVSIPNGMLGPLTNA